MEDTKPKITEAVRHLMAMPDDVVSAKYLAPILKMHPQTIINHVKSGLWDQEKLGNFVISGEGKNAHVKFFRNDFLQKCGFVEKEPEQPTELEMLGKIWEALADIRILVRAIANDRQEGAIERCVRENRLRF